MARAKVPKVKRRYISTNDARVVGARGRSTVAESWGGGARRIARALNLLEAVERGEVKVEGVE